jgi:hypothetical protein
LIHKEPVLSFPVVGVGVWFSGHRFHHGFFGLVVVGRGFGFFGLAGFFGGIFFGIMLRS